MKYKFNHHILLRKYLFTESKKFTYYYLKKYVLKFRKIVPMHIQVLWKQVYNALGFKLIKCWELLLNL